MFVNVFDDFNAKFNPTLPHIWHFYLKLSPEASFISSLIAR